MATCVKRPVFGLQCTQEVPQTSVQDMAAFYIQVGHSRPVVVVIQACQLSSDAIARKVLEVKSLYCDTHNVGD